MLTGQINPNLKSKCVNKRVFCLKIYVDVISSTTLPAFKRLLKTELFSRSFPDA